MFPAASRAVTVRRLAPACRTMPLAVQLVVPVAVPLPPRSFAHVTWVAPAGVPPRLRDARPVLYVGEAVGAVRATVGAVAAAEVPVAVRVAMLYAALCGATVRRLAPAWRTMPLAVQLVVPVAVPLPPRLFAHVTWVTPTLSAAVPPSVSAVLLAVYVGEAVGVVMATVGAVVSAFATVTLIPVEVVALPAAS